MAGGTGGYGGSNLPPMQPMQPMPPPVREKRGGANGCLIGGLIGCGVLLILLVVAGIAGMNALKGSKGGIGKMMSNIQAGQEYAPKLVLIGAALDRYKNDHNGTYPASLTALVPKYMPDKSAFTPKSNETTLEYTPPKPNAKPDAVVLSVTNGESEISFGASTSRSTLYYRLLKNGSIVQDQVQRVDMSNRLGGK